MLLTPQKGESEKDFISRFVSNNAMASETLDKEQRTSIAHSQWEKTKNNSEEFCHLEHNMSSLVKKQILNGKEYLVAPIKMMPEEFVMNGILYPAEATQAYPQGWNGRALVVYHPDEPVSANTPEFLATHKVGEVFNARIEDGFLKGDGFIDIESAKRLDLGRKLLMSLEQNKNIDVSTSMKNKTYNSEGVKFGRNYNKVVVSFIQDHLALLPDRKGAASWADGAGFARNNDNNNNPNTENKKMDKKELLAMLLSGGLISANEQKEFEALEDQAFGEKVKSIIDSNKEAVEAGVVAKNDLVKEKDEVEKLKLKIKKGEKAPDVELNAEDQATLDWAKTEIQKQKDKIVSTISANKDCGFSKEELNAKPVDELRKIATLIQPDVEIAVNYSGTGFPVPSDIYNNADKEYLESLNDPKKEK